MKAAMFCSGLPRFGKFFLDNLKLIKHDDFIDLYFYMWDSDIDYKNLLKKIPEYYKIKCLIQTPEPTRNEIVPRTSENESVDKIIESCFKQHYGLKNVFALISKDYCSYVRIRVDGKISKEINLKNYDVDDHLYIPKNMQYSLTNNIKPFNDQFAIGNYQNMKKYCSLFDSIDDLFFYGKVPIQQENALKYFLDQNGVSVVSADFEHLLENKK
jgi:hypothetical protein